MRTRNPNNGKSGNRRGYYIYGKNFFILPNKLWNKISENDKVVFGLNEPKIYVSLDKEYLVPTIREPSECAFQIQPEYNFYVLSIPDKPLNSLPDGVKAYIRHSRKLLSDEEIPAIGLYKEHKKRWYSHIWYSLREPFGSIIIPEKFRPFQRGVAAHYIKQDNTEFAVPVTFYTRSAGSPTKDMALVAWLNSTVGIAFRYQDRAWLGAASERMSGEQLDRMKILDVSVLSTKDLVKLGKLVLALPSPLPDFAEQLKEPFYSGSGRFELDSFILELLGVDKSRSEAYQNHCIGTVKKWIKTIQSLNP